MPDRVTQAVKEAQAILARHVEPGPRDCQKTINDLLTVLDDERPVQWMEEEDELRQLPFVPVSEVAAHLVEVRLVRRGGLELPSLSSSFQPRADMKSFFGAAPDAAGRQNVDLSQPWESR